ncbi:MAG: hypothetical protein QXV17_10040 [Candidatus Micrarchaeaceae archaeon]
MKIFVLLLTYIVKPLLIDVLEDVCTNVIVGKIELPDNVDVNDIPTAFVKV